MLVLSHRCVVGGEGCGGGGWLDWRGFWQTQCVTPPQIWPPASPQMSWQVWSGFVGQAVIECSTNGASLSSRSGGNCPRSRWPRPCRPPSRPGRTPCCRGPLAPLEGKEKKKEKEMFFNSVQSKMEVSEGVWTSWSLKAHKTGDGGRHRLKITKDWGCHSALRWITSTI